MEMLMRRHDMIICVRTEEERREAFDYTQIVFFASNHE